MRSLVELIARKRDGFELSSEQIHRLVGAFVAGEFADYQMSAFLMAVLLRGMSDAETVSLTEAMLRSGTVVDLSAIPSIKVDKHSTGGVGDKVSLCLVPIVASCGVPVPMVSGRGLGHTGGTLDKLESIPGFRVDLDVERFVSNVRDVGACMIGQTAQIAPADRRMYALRDVTATVESIPLIAASILSKKLAEGIDALVLDIKVGRGAFMKDLSSARALATALVRVGTLAGKRVTAVLTRMDAPLGCAVGNALETREAFDVLHDRAPADLTECTVALAAEMLLLANEARSSEQAVGKVREAIRTGQAARKMEQIIAAQDGDARVVECPDLLGRAPVVRPIDSPRSGWVDRIDAMEIGLACVALGAGRERLDQQIDPAVGVVLRSQVGSRVEKGDVLAELHLRSTEQAGLVEDRIRGAFWLADSPPQTGPIVIERSQG